MTTQFGSHVLKSKEGHPPAPGMTFVPGSGVVCLDGAFVVAVIERSSCTLRAYNLFTIFINP